MRDLNLVSGFRASEVPLLDRRMAMWAQPLAPEEQEHRWRKIIEITGLPDIRRDPGIRRINIEKVIRVAKSKECHEFRRWLRDSDDLSPEEIRDGFSGLLDQASILYRSGHGRALRLLITGFTPFPVSFALGALDFFVFERFLPERGPAAFIAETYPSLFRHWLPPQREPEQYRDWFRQSGR